MLIYRRITLNTKCQTQINLNWIVDRESRILTFIKQYSRIVTGK